MESSWCPRPNSQDLVNYTWVSTSEASILPGAIVLQPSSSSGPSSFVIGNGTIPVEQLTLSTAPPHVPRMVPPLAKRVKEAFGYMTTQATTMSGVLSLDAIVAQNFKIMDATKVINEWREIIFVEH